MKNVKIEKEIEKLKKEIKKELGEEIGSEMLTQIEAYALFQAMETDKSDCKIVAERKNGVIKINTEGKRMSVAYCLLGLVREHLKRLDIEPEVFFELLKNTSSETRDIKED